MPASTSMSFRSKVVVFIALHVLFGLSVGSPTASHGFTTSTSSVHTKRDQPKQGWTSSPEGRGTWDIIWSCGVTMFLCSWSVLCLNVPGPNNTRLQVLRRKMYLVALGLLGPEFIAQIAFGQWISARHSVADFHASGYTEWTMSHAFFADMGGFVLHTSDFDPFPIDAKQLLYLLTRDYIKLSPPGKRFSPPDKRIIADKDKVDGLLRIITVCQTLWFVVNVSGRAAQHLAITCGELTAAAFIVCSFGTTVCWFKKPADVATPEAIEANKSIAEILEEAGEPASKPWNRTPLEFVSRKEWPWSLYWSNWINILRNMHITFGPHKRPVDRFENTITFEIPGTMLWLSIGVTAVYTSIFIGGWNYTFPTPVEQTLWRTASVTVLGTMIVYFSTNSFVFSLYPAIQRRFSLSAAQNVDAEKRPETRKWPGHGHFTRKAKYVAACIRNNSVIQDPALTVPLKAILPMYVLGVLYCTARTYIFLSDILELRSLPASAYSTVNWANYFPHF